MKMVDLYFSYKYSYKDYVVMMQSGNFYCVYDSDAGIINKLMNYQLKPTGSTVKVGFPMNSLVKVIQILEKNKVNYLVIESVEQERKITVKKNFNQNMYETFVYNMDQYYLVSARIERIIHVLQNKTGDPDITKTLDSIEACL